VLTLLIAGYVLWQVATMLPDAIRILMEGAPPDLDLNELVEAMQNSKDVAGVHHLHVWQLDESHRALEAHVVVANADMSALESVKSQLKTMLDERFAITHSTMEFEAPHGKPHAEALVPEH
jgi:cobalt-zinc-cadmium efflux system protein